MNNLWQVERLVELKQQEIERELAQAQLLREAGIRQGNWLGRAVAAIRRLGNRRRKAPREYASVERQPSASVSD